MGLKSRKILGISITTDPKNKILEFLENYLEKNSKFKIQNSKLPVAPLIIVTPNPEQIVYARSDSHFANILNRADVEIPDGIGIALAARALSITYHVSRITYELQKIPGIEFMEDLVAMAAAKGHRIALIGGRGGVAVRALECLRLRYPQLKGWAGDGPEIAIENGECLPAGEAGTMENENTKERIDVARQYNNIAIQQSGGDITDQYFQQIAEKIRRTDTRLVFVGLGAPKQEYFIERVKSQVLGVKQEISKVMIHDTLTHDTPLVLMSVGGAFDMIAGVTPRAPRVVREVGLEWLWRLMHEPRRFRRQLALGTFAWLVLKELLTRSILAGKRNGIIVP